MFQLNIQIFFIHLYCCCFTFRIFLCSSLSSFLCCKMFLLFSLLVISFFQVSVNATYSTFRNQEPTMFICESNNEIPQLYDGIVKMEENRMVINPKELGTLLTIAHKKGDEEEIQMIINWKSEKGCRSKNYFLFVDANDQQLFKFSIQIQHENILIYHGIKQETIVKGVSDVTEIRIKETSIMIGSSSVENVKLQIIEPFDDYWITRFFTYRDGDNADCSADFKFPLGYRLALDFLNNTRVETTSTMAAPVTMVSSSTLTPTTEVLNAGLAVHWMILLLILDILVCAAIGGFSTWVYEKLSKKYKKNEQSLSFEDSHDEEIETAIEDIALAARSGEVGNQNMNESMNVSKSMSKSAAPIAGSTLGSRLSNIQTAKPPSNKAIKNVSKEPGNKVSVAAIDPQNEKQKSKKSFLEKMSNKFKRKKNANSKKLQQPQISVSGFTSSTTMNIPFHPSKEVIKARDKAKHLPAVEKRVSQKKVKVAKPPPLSKEIGVDQQGCEATQASREESYQIDVANMEQARRNAEMYARLFTPDGKIRTAKELAEYDEAKKAAEKKGPAAARPKKR